MAKKQDTELQYLISLNESHKGLKIITNLDADKDKKFNSGEKVIINEDELKLIGEHRWLIKEKYNGN